MSTAFPTAGLWMLAALGVLILTTGLPVWVLLIGSASAFAAVGVALGTMDVGVLSAISARTQGLLEHDLLQALPLYVFVGVLLQRLTVADALFATLARLPGRGAASTALAAMGVGALVAPMNGSVASTSALLARLVAPRLGRMDGGNATALVSVAATIGVVVPPSLVLILLGDTMLRAHTEASNLPGYALGAQRIINTQDVFHAALLPAAAVLLLWLGVAWWQGRQLAPVPTPSATRRQWLMSTTSVTAVALLLTGVFRGTILAVEGAATAGVVLVAASLASRTLSRAQWQAVLVDTLTLSGALLALLVGATTFSLVFRLWGTDRWISELVLGSSLPALSTAALVLALVALCAWVLDAFEMIFVIIPIVAPPLIILLGDAQQAAVLLLLLVLQLSFLIPPMGYAVMMARSRAGLAHTPLRHTLWPLLPYLVVQAAVTLAVFAVPALVHALDGPPPTTIDATAPSPQDVEQMMRDMAGQGQTADPAPDPAPANVPRP